MKKIQSLLTIGAVLAASHLPGQSADALVAAGRALLANTNKSVAYANLPAAYSDFNQAVLRSPTNAAANVLAAATRLLLLPQQAGASNALNRLGVSAQGRDVFNWTAHFQTNRNGQVVLPANLNSTEAIALLNTNVMPALQASLTNLDRITNRAFTLSLTAEETHVRAVTLDWGDIELMRAVLHAAQFVSHTLNAHNFSVVITHLQNLGSATPSQLTVQKVLADYPKLLAPASKNEVVASKTSLTNAIAHYLVASEFIRDTNNRPPDIGLFDLAPDEADDEATFRDALTKALASLDHPVSVVSNSTALVYTAPYFAGSLSLRSLLPLFNGDRYVSNSLPDYTFGGMLLDEPAYVTESLLREKLAPRSFAGIYIGQMDYSGGVSIPEDGGFALFVGADQRASFLGYGTALAAGFFAQSTIQSDGSWWVTTNNISLWGYINQDGSTDGGAQNVSHVTWWEDMYGNLASDAGSFQSAAGYYNGTWKVATSTGRLSAILSADGQVYYCQFSGSGQPGDGGKGQLDASGRFTSLSVGGTSIGGVLNSAALQITGNFTNQSGTGTFTLGRSASIPHDTPPTISTPPSDQIGTSGSNVTFKVVATGSPPLCYQWSVNGRDIRGATSASLVVSNLQATRNPTNFTVVVQNIAGSNSATARLSMVVNETVPPKVAITSPTNPGQLWSNAVFCLTGTAQDNVAVSNVWCQLNNGGWETATGTTNWTKCVTLTPGTNFCRIYAEDASANHSLVATGSVRYVVSDRLGVQATGPCTMSPNYSNAVLEIGKTYTNAVTPGKGFVFSNWVGTVMGNVVLVSNAPKLTFIMRSNLVLQANIILNPFIPVKGTYNGLFGQTNRAQESSGFFTLTLTTNGAYSGSLKPGSNSYALSGQFDLAGRASQVVSRPGTNAWGVGMGLDFGARQLRGWVSNGMTGGWVADLLADLAVFDARTNPATQYVGKYTLSIPGDTNQDGTVWLGDGYLTLSVDAGGKLTYSGSLADGASTGPASVPVSGEGYVPLYVPLYSGKGSVWSWLTFDANQPATGLEGWLSWIRPVQAGAYYPVGLTNEVLVEGARYTPPAGTTSRVIALTNGVMVFEGGNLTGPLTNAVMLTATNKVIDLSLTNKLSLSLTVSNGTFAGSVREPGLTRSNSFKGVLLQDQNSGYGYFLETNRSGRVLLWPTP
jgi:hypothetical protein